MEDERIFLKFLSSLKKKWVLLAVAAVGIALVLWGGSLSCIGKTSQSSKEEDTLSQTEAYRKQLEAEIGVLCRSVRGAGEVQVMVTLSCGESKSYSAGQLLSSELPKVEGVAVLCEGGESDTVRASLAEMISALLGIGTHRIFIGTLSSL